MGILEAILLGIIQGIAEFRTFSNISEIVWNGSSRYII